MRATPAILATALVAVGAAATASAATKGVSVRDDLFSPKSLTVSKGDTVRWTWRGRKPHDVKVTRGPVRFQSRVQSSGTYSRKLTRSGTYRIVCTIHDGMAMTLRVR